MRKIIQISATAHDGAGDEASACWIYALCDDGSVWAMNGYGGSKKRWFMLPPIPQPTTDVDSRIKALLDANAGER